MTSSSFPISILFSVLLFSPLGYGHSPSCGCSSAAAAAAAVRSDHPDHDHGGDHIHHHHHEHGDIRLRKLPEELAEEEDLQLEGFGHHHHHHHDHHAEHDVEVSPLGLWVKAMGCSLLVSLASLICLIFLPVICLKGKPSKAVVDSLAVFGAGAMLGDAFLHQLPHAFVEDNHSYPCSCRCTDCCTIHH